MNKSLTYQSQYKHIADGDFFIANAVLYKKIKGNFSIAILVDHVCFCVLSKRRYIKSVFAECKVYLRLPEKYLKIISELKLNE